MHGAPPQTLMAACGAPARKLRCDAAAVAGLPCSASKLTGVTWEHPPGVVNVLPIAADDVANADDATAVCAPAHLRRLQPALSVLDTDFDAVRLNNTDWTATLLLQAPPLEEPLGASSLDALTGLPASPWDAGATSHTSRILQRLQYALAAPEAAAVACPPGGCPGPATTLSDFAGAWATAAAAAAAAAGASPVPLAAAIGYGFAASGPDVTKPSITLGGEVSNPWPLAAAVTGGVIAGLAGCCLCLWLAGCFRRRRRTKEETPQERAARLATEAAVAEMAAAAAAASSNAVAPAASTV